MQPANQPVVIYQVKYYKLQLLVIKIFSLKLISRNESCICKNSGDE